MFLSGGRNKFAAYVGGQAGRKFFSSQKHFEFWNTMKPIFGYFHAMLKLKLLHHNIYIYKLDGWRNGMGKIIWGLENTG